MSWFLTETDLIMLENGIAKSGTKAVETSLINAQGSGAGVRLINTGENLNFPGKTTILNLPNEAYYSIWYYFPQNIKRSS